MKKPRKSVRESVARAIQGSDRPLSEVCADLLAEHGAAGAVALWRQLSDRELTLSEAESQWKEALDLAKAKSLSLPAALYEVARQHDADFASGRIVSGESYRMLQDSSSKDYLTGLYNRRHFEDAFHRELKRSKRYRHPLSVLILDLDDFKTYNDTNGHLAGDQALRDTAKILHANCREIDIVCRYGGEEFVAILPATDKNGARVLGEKLRRRLEEHSFEGEENLASGQLTISGGIASFPEDGLTGEELLGNADQALYQAKNFIKNAVCYYFREDRRAYPRIEKEYVLRYRTIGERKWTTARTRDISHGGLSFAMEKDPLSLGTEIELEIRAGSEPLEVQGRIVRVERYEEDGPHTLGVSFEEPPEDVAARLGTL